VASVIPFRTKTDDLDPEEMLEELKGKTEGFVLVGFTPEGEVIMGCTYSDRYKVNWLVDVAKQYVMESE
jgi:hypothetical protein